MFLFYTPHDPAYVAQVRFPGGKQGLLYPGELEDFELEKEPNLSVAKRVRALRREHRLADGNVWLQVGDVFQDGDRILLPNEQWEVVAAGDLRRGEEITEADILRIPQGLPTRQSSLSGDRTLVYQPGHGFAPGARVRQLNSSEVRYIEAPPGDSIAALWGTREVYKVESEDYFIVGPVRERAPAKPKKIRQPAAPSEPPGRRKFDLDA